mmetsp:Transcript_26208/g.64713  ORF Transcript_26208/g.64713 Transcript_26208/m.64713 type:complete len:228 (+) Transcript_26208:1931-2614(+)
MRQLGESVVHHLLLLLWRRRHHDLRDARFRGRPQDPQVHSRPPGPTIEIEGRLRDGVGQSIDIQACGTRHVHRPVPHGPQLIRVRRVRVIALDFVDCGIVLRPVRLERVVKGDLDVRDPVDSCGVHPGARRQSLVVELQRTVSDPSVDALGILGDRRRCDIEPGKDVVQHKPVPVGIPDREGNRLRMANFESHPSIDHLFQISPISHRHACRSHSAHHEVHNGLRGV